VRIGARRGQHRRMVRLRQDSPLRGVDPRIKLVLTLLITAAVMLPLHRLLIYAGLFTLLLAYARLLGEATYQVRRIIWLVVVLFALDWAFIGIEFAILITVRLVVIVSASALLFGTTTVEEFRQGLRGLGLPRRYSFALSLAFQSVPLASAQWRAIQEAQRARGIIPEGRGWRGWRGWVAQLRNLVALAVPAVVLTAQRAWALTEAAYARGFGAPQRSPAPRPRLHWRDWALVGGALGCVLLLGLYP